MMEELLEAENSAFRELDATLYDRKIEVTECIMTRMNTLLSSAPMCIMWQNLRLQKNLFKPSVAPQIV